MKYDGVVIRIDDQLYLFILDPKKLEIKDGINISEHTCYKNLKNDQLMVVTAIFMDGTKEINEIEDLEDFIHSEGFCRHDIFIKIRDVALFSIADENKKSESLKKIIRKGKLTDIATECIELTKQEITQQIEHIIKNE